MSKDICDLSKRPFMRAAAINCRCVFQNIIKEELYKMSKKLKSLDAGSAIISGSRGMVGEMLTENVNLGAFTSGNLVCAKGTIGGCDFTIRGLESEMESIIGMVRPYPGFGPVQVGHTYRGIKSGDIATAVFVSNRIVVSRYDNGSEFACSTDQFNERFKAVIDPKAMTDLEEDLSHYRGRVPEQLVNECMALIKKFQ